MAKLRLTFNFFDTEEQAADFCFNYNAKSSYYMRKISLHIIRHGAVATEKNKNLLHGIIIKKIATAASDGGLFALGVLCHTLTITLKRKN